MHAKTKAAALAAVGGGSASVATMAARGEESAPVTHAELAALVAIVERLVDRQSVPAPAPAPLATWVTLRQASELSGLSEGLLRRLLREGKLHGLRDRCTKVRRVDLEGLDL